MRRFLSVLIAVFALTLVVSAATLAHGNEKHYRADLASLNSSGVSGTAELTLSGDQLTVTITATGLEPNSPHPQHIHGAVDNKGNATCPPPAADVNGDGVVDVNEGVPFYGPVLLSLQPFNQVAADGTLNFQQTFTVDARALGPLQNRAIVLHGLTLESGYVASTPVACGQIRSANGQGQ